RSEVAVVVAITAEREQVVGRFMAEDVGLRVVLVVLIGAGSVVRQVVQLKRGALPAILATALGPEQDGVTRAFWNRFSVAVYCHFVIKAFVAEVFPGGPSCSTGKSWLHFWPPPVDFCGSRLAIGAATERARALIKRPGTRAQAQQTRANS